MNYVVDALGFTKGKGDLAYLESKYPNWLFREKEGFIYGFANINGYKDRTKPEALDNTIKVAVRISLHGMFFFSNKVNPNKYYLSEGNYLSLENIKEINGDSVYYIEVGSANIKGEISYTDCVFEPGLTNQSFLEVNGVFEDIIKPYVK